MNLSVICNYTLLGVFLEHAPEGWDDGLMADVDQLGKCLAECFCCFLQVVVGDLREQVMDLVSANAGRNSENQISELNQCS